METGLPLHLTTFVGRDYDIATLAHMVTTRRLVTLVGPGGIGKTRLALRVSAEIEAQFADGSTIVELASFSDPNLVLQTVASTVGIREQGGTPLLNTVIEELRPRHLLLVLDNCEHVIEACATLTQALLQRCPHLHLLATSREGLRLTGETLWRVSSLAYPPLIPLPGHEEVLRYDAVRLFCDRATAVTPYFRVTEQNTWAIVHICHSLDGIPLALELAAARMQTLSLEELATRLDERFQMLNDGSHTASPRHRTLQAALDWSYTLLSTDEQRLLQRLSIFAGSWTLEAAEEICSDEHIDRYDVLTVLTQLVHKSWVMADAHEETGAVSYRLLETIQQYAQHSIHQSEELRPLYKRHWEWYLHFAEEAIHHLHGAEQGTWLQHVESSLANLRLALERSLSAHQVEVTVRIATALEPFWTASNRLSEGRQWYETLLALPDLPKALRANLLQQPITILRFQGEDALIRALLEERITLLIELDATAELAETYASLGWTAFYQGRCEEAIHYFNEGRLLAHASNNQWQYATCLSGLAMVATLQEEYPRAKELLQEVITIWRSLQDYTSLAYALTAQAHVAAFQGEEPLARAACREILQLTWRQKQALGTTNSFEAIAALATLCGDAKRAVWLFSSATVLRTSIGIPFPPSMQVLQERELLPLRAQLGPDQFTQQWAYGESLSQERAYAEAVAVLEETRQPPAPNPLERLSRRERDVLRLVGQGLTDAQVAQELVLSTRTVSTHLQSVYRKLGVSSRSAATRFALEHHLT